MNTGAERGSTGDWRKLATKAAQPSNPYCCATMSCASASANSGVRFSDANHRGSRRCMSMVVCSHTNEVPQLQLMFRIAFLSPDEYPSASRCASSSNCFKPAGRIDSTCCFSFAHVSKPYSRAIANCASASVASGWSVCSSPARQRLSKSLARFESCSSEGRAGRRENESDIRSPFYGPVRTRAKEDRSTLGKQILIGGLGPFPRTGSALRTWLQPNSMQSASQRPTLRSELKEKGGLWRLPFVKIIWLPTLDNLRNLFLASAVFGRSEDLSKLKAKIKVDSISA